MTKKTENKYKKILLVEDDESVVSVLKKKSAEENFELIMSENGEDGLKKAETIKPNLILLDIIMPKMDGMEMLKKMRATNWGKNIPVIILTNLSNPFHEEEAKKLNVVDYLIKTDCHLEDIFKKIKKFLRK